MTVYFVPTFCAAPAPAQTLPPKPAAKKPASAVPKAVKKAEKPRPAPAPTSIVTIVGILPGMTRAQVEAVYRPAGGVSRRFDQAYPCAAPSFGLTTPPFGWPSRTPEPLFGLTTPFGISEMRGWQFTVTFKAAANKNDADNIRKDRVVFVSEPFIGPVFFD